MPDRRPGRERQPVQADTPRGRLAAFLRDCLDRCGYSSAEGFHRDLAKRIEVTHSTVDRWLSGKTPIAWDHLESISRTLGYSSHQRLLADYAEFRPRKSRSK